MHGNIFEVMQKLLNIKDVSEALGVTVRTVTDYYTKGVMPKPLRIGSRKTLRWRESALDEWIESGCPDMSENMEGG